MYTPCWLLLDDALKPTTPLTNGAPISGVAGLSASSSSKADTFNNFDVKTAGCDSYFTQLECGPMAALPNIGGALCSTPQFG